MNNISNKTAMQVMAGLMTAVICVLSPLSSSLPFSPVPISLSVLAVLLTVYVTGMKFGTLCVILYILIGMVGVPVFAGYTAGAGKLAGPTGGYIIGYIFLALIAGFFVTRYKDNLFLQTLGMLIGLTACYLFGTVWFTIVMDVSFAKAMSLCVLPFLPADAVKIFIALIVGNVVRKRLPSVFPE